MCELGEGVEICVFSTSTRDLDASIRKFRWVRGEVEDDSTCEDLRAKDGNVELN